MTTKPRLASRLAGLSLSRRDSAGTGKSASCGAFQFPIAPLQGTLPIGTLHASRLAGVHALSIHPLSAGHASLLGTFCASQCSHASSGQMPESTGPCVSSYRSNATLAAPCGNCHGTRVNSPAGPIAKVSLSDGESSRHATKRPEKRAPLALPGIDRARI